ncbi:AsmA family protein [Geotalea sp. SG265]|uniref:AsmA family protein n=1 Tax=Geotalea sp. SG265 TaxID=2922867 RepID=UPI001FAF7BD0|nr:AsmA family protein [Geotalea sp. SG265]
MNKTLKITGIVVAAIVVFFTIVAVLVKVLVSPAGVRKTVLPMVEKKLQRQVRLGDVQVSVFSGIVLKNLTVLEKDGVEPFVQAGLVKLKYRFWPLLSGRVVVNQILLDSPAIKVIRLPDGTFNYSDILAKKEQAAPQAKPEKGEINLLVSQVALTGGKIRYEDRKTNGRPFIYEITGVEIDAKDIAMDRQFPFTVKATVPGAKLEMGGNAADVGKKPAMNAVVTIKAADLGKLVAGLPPQLAAKTSALAPSGEVNVRLHLAGPVSAPKELLKDGEVKLTKVAVTASGQRPVLSGTLALKGRELSSRDLVLVMGSNTLKLAFTVADLLGKPLSLTSSVSADRFDLDPFLRKSPKKAGAAEEKPEPGPMNLPVRAVGSIQLGQTSLKGLPVTGLSVKYRLAENVLSIDELKGNVAGGSFNDTARIDLGRKGFAYTTALSVAGVKAETLVTALAPKPAGTVFGTLSFKGQVSGMGTQMAAMKKNISGQGNYEISQGKLTGPGLVQSLAQFLGIEQLRVINFEKFNGSFRVSHGKIMIDSTIAGRDVQMAPKGTAGLDKSLDISLQTRIAPQLTGRITGGRLGRFVTDDKGWGILPLKVTGNFSAPKFALDVSAVREQLKQKGKEQLERTIREKLLKGKEGERQPPEKELLEKGLRGILGK